MEVGCFCKGGVKATDTKAVRNTIHYSGPGRNNTTFICIPCTGLST